MIYNDYIPDGPIAKKGGTQTRQPLTESLTQSQKKSPMKYRHHQTALKILLLALSFPVFTGTISAQKQITRQSLYWVRYYGKYRFSPKWGATLELEDRRFFHDNRNLNWLLPRVAVTRSLGSGWSAAAGFTYYLSDNPQDPDQSVALTVPELRPHEELTYQQKTGNLSIKHRYRLEERFTRKNDGTELQSGYDFKWRLRYQLQLQYPLIKRKTAAGTLTIKASDEILLNLGHSVVRHLFDQNRIYVALNYSISKSVQAELGYLDWFQERSSGDQYYRRDIARLTMYHTLNFYHRK